MMRYAQSARCRMRLLQEYFGELEAPDCGRCDNCLAHAHGLAAAGLAEAVS
jgi:ATP-dependent DNA helicase RecQ